MKSPSSAKAPTGAPMDAPVTAVVLAGGKGTRLRPFTVTFPKPLVPVGDKPILERLLLQLADAGVTRVVLSLGHLSSLIRSYIDHHQALNDRLAISYVEEDTPLGTAGAIRLVQDLDESFFVMNGDLLTDIDFGRLLADHKRADAALTVGRVERSEKIDFGVLELDETGSLKGYKEKPAYSYSVSMGVYVYEPRVVSYIEKEERLDFPELVIRLLSNNEKVHTYLHTGLWLDIGRPDDYAKAQEWVEKEGV